MDHLLEICIVFFCIIVLVFLREKFSFKTSIQLEEHVSKVLHFVDNPYQVRGDEIKDVRKMRGRFQAWLIGEAKIEFGMLQRSESNRLMVRKYLKDLMINKGMRPSHIHANLDMSVAIFFIPSKIDIAVNSVGATLDAQRRNDKYYGEWTSMFGRLGQKLGFSQQ